MLGASTVAEPGAPGGATWGLGELREATGKVPKLVRYVRRGSGSWEPGPELPAGFQPDHPGNTPEPLEGQIERDGYGVLAGTVPSGKATRQACSCASPGAHSKRPPRCPARVRSNPAKNRSCTTGQTLYGAARAPMIAPLARRRRLGRRAGRAGLPRSGGRRSGAALGRARLDGRADRDPGASNEEFKVLAVAADGPENAWLLARLSSSYGEHAVALFRRVQEAGGWRWKPVEAEVGPGQVKLAAERSSSAAARRPQASRSPSSAPRAERSSKSSRSC